MTTTMMNKIITRLKNPKVLLAIVSGTLIILVNLGVIDIAMSEKAIEVTNTLLGIGIAIGVFGNPESHVKSK